MKASTQVRRTRGSAVPPADRALLRLPGADYVDWHALAVDGADGATPEAWARAMFEDPRPAHRRLRLGLLGVLMTTPQPKGRVGPWTIVERDERFLRMESISGLTHDAAVVRVDPQEVALGVAVRYRRRVAAVIWPVVATQHRRLAPVVLSRSREVLGLAPPAVG
jgi:hypothetical protein